jgi:hypothetical protein
LSGLVNDFFGLGRCDQALRQERFDRLRDSGDVLAVILPGPARGRAAARRELVNAATV